MPKHKQTYRYFIPAFHPLKYVGRQCALCKIQLPLFFETHTCYTCGKTICFSCSRPDEGTGFGYSNRYCAMHDGDRNDQNDHIECSCPQSRLRNSHTPPPGFFSPRGMQ